MILFQVQNSIQISLRLVVNGLFDRVHGLNTKRHKKLIRKKIELVRIL